MSGTSVDAYVYFKRDGFTMKGQNPIAIVEGGISFYFLSFEMYDLVDKQVGDLVKQ